MHKLLRGVSVAIAIGGMAVLPLVASADDGDTPPPADDLPPALTTQQLIPNIDQVLAIANADAEPALDYIASTLPVLPPADDDIQP